MTGFVSVSENAYPHTKGKEKRRGKKIVPLSNHQISLRISLHSSTAETDATIPSLPSYASKAERPWHLGAF